MTSTSSMSSSLFKNLELISKRFPKLGEMICTVNPTRIQVAGTEDGGICYVKQQNASYLTLSSTTPVKDAQNAVNGMIDRIQNGCAPVVIVGLNPGYELDIVYKHFKENYYNHYIPRRIYVIIDSLECFYGWLKREDRSEILENEGIEFHWHENVKNIVALIEQEETRSHLVIPVSSLPEEKVMRIIKPLADLFLIRQSEEKAYHIENCAYYEEQSDAELNQILNGKANRKPRILIPSHASSTVVQYSVRDTKAMFEKEGWEVKIINMKTDLSRWRVSKEINTFKPDVYLIVNHLRTQELNFYPPDIMFITWIQDTVSFINNSKNAHIWNEHVESKEKCRDLIIGYVSQIREYGYLEERLEECPMIVNEDIFNPVDLTPEEKEKYECDVCFASNRSKETTLIVKEDLTPKLSKLGFTEALLMDIHDHLWTHYRSEETCTTYSELERKISELPVVNLLLTNLSKDDHDFIIQRLFWELNDVIYRHIVLEWIADTKKIKLNLYGRDWERHPKFSKYAKGSLNHGQDLSFAYNNSNWCLHLNSMEGQHQRIWEIIEGNGIVLNRISEENKQNHSSGTATLKLALEYFDSHNSTKNDLPEELHEELELIIYQILKKSDSIENLLICFNNAFIAKVENIMIHGQSPFGSKNELYEIFSKSSEYSQTRKIYNELKSLLSRTKLYCRIESKVCKLLGSKSSIEQKSEFFLHKHVSQKRIENLLKLNTLLKTSISPFDTSVTGFCKSLLKTLEYLETLHDEILVDVCFKLVYLEQFNHAKRFFASIRFNKISFNSHYHYHLLQLCLDEDNNPDSLKNRFHLSSRLQNLWCHSGWIKYWRCHPKIALEFFNIDSRQNSINQDFMLKRAALFARLGENQKAKEIVESVDLPNKWAIIAWWQLSQNLPIEASLKYFEKDMKAHNLDAEFTCMYASLLFENNQLQEALKTLTKVPANHIDIHSRLAWLSAINGDFEQAWDLYEKDLQEKRISDESMRDFKFLSEILNKHSINIDLRNDRFHSGWKGNFRIIWLDQLHINQTLELKLKTGKIKAVDFSNLTPKQLYGLKFNLRSTGNKQLFSLLNEYLNQNGMAGYAS